MSRCKRFERGLRPEIRRQTLSHRIRVYSELVDTAAAIETGMAEIGQAGEQRPRLSGFVGQAESRDSKRPRVTGPQRASE